VAWAAIILVAILAAIAVSQWPLGATPETPARPPQAPETREEFARIPKIDVHVHVAPMLADDAIEILGAEQIEMAINASGGVPGQGAELSAQIAERTGGRLLFYCNFPFRAVEDPDFAALVDETLESCKRLGAVGLKIFKSLGLGITLSDGSLLRVDDPRLDPLFAKAGALSFPVLIHTGDPQAFFRPPTPDNERFAELSAHPDWSFHGARRDNGQPWPTWEELYAQLEARIARHPQTRFLGAHFGNAPEDPDRVERMLDRHANFFVETGARIPEIGRHPPERMRRLFERHQDRILFGSDLAVSPDGLTLGSRGEGPDRREDAPRFFRAHWRWFETDGRRMAHPTPIQGDWTIDGIALPRAILEKVYWRNAARLFGIQLPRGG
jgi:predicted TIM-barrel fold metal-dependent hydrolase